MKHFTQEQCAYLLQKPCIYMYIYTRAWQMWLLLGAKLFNLLKMLCNFIITTHLHNRSLTPWFAEKFLVHVYLPIWFPVFQRILAGGTCERELLITWPHILLKNILLLQAFSLSAVNGNKKSFFTFQNDKFFVCLFMLKFLS